MRSYRITLPALLLGRVGRQTGSGLRNAYWAIKYYAARGARVRRCRKLGFDGHGPRSKQQERDPRYIEVIILLNFSRHWVVLYLPALSVL